MFHNIGKKIQVLAKIVAIIGVAVSVIAGLFVLLESSVGLIIIAGGALLSWIGSLMTYGFGILVEQAEVSLGKTKASENEEPVAEPEVQHKPPKPHVPGWSCVHCGARNPLGVHKCIKCGRG